MKISRTLTAAALALLLGAGAIGMAQADENHRGAKNGMMGQGMMGQGKGMISQEEREGFRDAMREAETQEERQEIRKAMRETMKQRAKEKGIEFKEHGGKGMKTGDCPDKSQKSQES